jgi:hypothetical protein
MIKNPFLRGDGSQARSRQSGEFHAGFGPGTWFIRLTSGEQFPPILRYRDPNIQATSEEVYSGCRGFWVINAFAWRNQQGGDGVSFGISMYQKTGDGERLGGGRIDPSEWFDRDLASKPDGKSGDITKGAGGLFS